MDRTDSKNDTPVARGRSGPVRYELIDKDGYKYGPYDHPDEATDYAMRRWPDQEQDPDRTGKGWDVQACGAE